MSKEITVEELEANLQESIEEASRGETLIVVAAGNPVATLAPPPASKNGIVFAQRADRTKRLGDFKPTGLGRKLDFDIVDVIREDRDKR